MAFDWHDHIPPDLRSVAYIASNGELAWPRDAALKVYEVLTDKSFVILGVEVWLATTPGPTPALHSWSRSNDHSAPGAPLSAGAYIEGFKWGVHDVLTDEEPYFNFAVTGTGSPPLAPDDESPLMDQEFSADCRATLRNLFARSEWSLGTQLVTRSDEWGLVWRADFIYGRDLRPLVNRAICWQPDGDGIAIVLAIGQQIAPLERFPLAKP